jgi:hypothetical protein
MDREFFRTYGLMFWPGRSVSRRIVTLAMSVACAQLIISCASAPPAAETHIDRLYRDAVTLLDRPTSSRAVDFSHLATEIDALSAADLSADPCLSIKKARLAPILFSLAVIDGMPDKPEKRQLQEQAKQRLLTLGEPLNQPGPDNFCYGRGFPQLTGR